MASDAKTGHPAPSSPGDRAQVAEGCGVTNLHLPFDLAGHAPWLVAR